MSGRELLHEVASVAPGGGAIQFEVDNDQLYYTIDDDNTLTDFPRTSLYAK